MSTRSLPPMHDPRTRVHVMSALLALLTFTCTAYGQSIQRAWGTFYGGQNFDRGYACAVDASGNVYLAGETQSLADIALSGHQDTLGGLTAQDAFLAKFDTNGVLLWATYYGGEQMEYGRDVAVDPLGNVYLAGYTNSATGIAANGHQMVPGGSRDAFLVKFDPNGVRLWGTYYGGSDIDEGLGCSVDGNGNVYLSGTTGSASGMAAGGHQNSYGDNDDVFLVKFDANGNRLWATYYGGSDLEDGGTCTTDAAGNVFLAGTTYSTAGMASGGHQNSISGDADAFLVKFDGAGVRQWATYYGGASTDEGFSCAVDPLGNVFLAGTTSSFTGIASGGHQNARLESGGGDAFLVKFNSSGIRQWGTYYGATGFDEGEACVADGSGNVYLAGTASSVTDIADGGFQNSNAGAKDAFLAKFDGNGVRQWGTYNGGPGFDDGMGVAIDQAGDLFLAGFTLSTTGFHENGHQVANNGGRDAFLTRFNAGASAGLAVSVRAFLQGPFDGGSGLMDDGLRVDATIPLAEPYSSLGYGHVIGGGETVLSPVFTTAGPDAIVDWVVLELRAADDPGVVVASRSCLLQRDGDVVDTDGTSAVFFNVPAGDHHLALVHRNHLPVLTAAPYSLSAVPILVDLSSPATPVWGVEARADLGGVLGLWSGDANFNGEVKYTGSGNDRDAILALIGGVIPTNTVGPVYAGEDTNMDGQVSYTGAANDRDPVLQSIGGIVPTQTRVAQLP